MSNSKGIQENELPDVWEQFSQGRSPHSIAANFGVSYSAIRNALQKLMDDPSLRKKKNFEPFADVQRMVKKELWETDPTIGDVKNHPEILEKYR